MTIIDLSPDARLCPVIELEPGNFGSCPDLGPGPRTVDQRATYWRTCLACSGIVDLAPIQLGSWFVSVHDLTAPFPLNKIIQLHLADEEGPTASEDVCPLVGGFVLYHGSEPVLFPGCCGDLGNLEEWKSALAQRADSPTMLWVGHPWFFCWFEDGMFHIREEREYQKPEDPTTVRLTAESLQSAIAAADRALDDFLPRVVSTLRTMPHLGPADEIGSRLLGR
ncbi:MAG: hypothetical protein U0441_32435 [Polyangiaceae bacterium]